MTEYNIYELLYMHHAGDQQASGMLEGEMRSWMQRWVSEKVRLNQNALHYYSQELYQEALMGMYDAIENYRNDKDAGFITFLKVVVERRMHNFLRGVKTDTNEVSMEESFQFRNREVSLKDMIETKDDLSSPEYALAYQETKDLLHDVVSHMRKSDQSVLYAFHEFENYTDAAEKLNMSVRVYGSKLRRAREKMKEEFQKKRRST